MNQCESVSSQKRSMSQENYLLSQKEMSHDDYTTESMKLVIKDILMSHGAIY